MDFPTKETSVGSWFGFVGGMCTIAQYFEVDGVILDLSNSYWGGRVALIVLQVKSHNNLTKLLGLRLGFSDKCWGSTWQGMAVGVLRTKVRGARQGRAAAFI